MINRRYTPVNISAAFRFALVIRSGLEPETYCLEGSCSIQLSYQTILFCFAGAKVGIFSQTDKYLQVNLTCGRVF